MGAGVSSNHRTSSPMRRAIKHAIARGVPLWNRGDTKGCAQVYMAVALKHSNEDVRLERAIERAREAPSDSSSLSAGWILRRAFDAVLSSRAPVQRASQRSSTMVRDIETAIQRGVPLWNRGDISACTCVYAAAARQHSSASPRLAAALAACASAPSDASRNSQAWILRRAFDAVLASPPSSRRDVAAAAAAASAAPRPKQASATARRPADMAQAIRAAIAAGVPQWNAGDRSACVRLYRAVAIAHASESALLARAVADCRGADVTAAGWTLRRALDAVLADAATVTPPRADAAAPSSTSSLAASPLPVAVAVAVVVDSDARASADDAPQSLPPSDGANECIVCMDAAPTHAFIPCGHRCVCLACSETIMSTSPRRCPVCRADATMAVLIYVG